MNTNDKSIASKISGKIRTSGVIKKDKNGEKIIGPDGKSERIPGRFKGVQAGGMMYDENIAQVSMNLLNYHNVALHDVFEATKEEAEKLGAKVMGSEIVGLVPKEALLLAGRFYAKKNGIAVLKDEEELVSIAIDNLGLGQLYPFDPHEKVIEYMVEDVGPLASSTVKGFLSELADDALDHLARCPPAYLQVQPQRQIPDIFGVVVYPLLKVPVGNACSGDLPEPGNAGSDRQPGVTPPWSHCVLGFGRGPWPDHAHLACKDVEKLRYLVDVCVPQESPRQADAGIIIELELRTVDLTDCSQLLLDPVGARVHRSELQAVERLSESPLTPVLIEHRARGSQLNRQRYERRNGGKQNQYEHSEEDIRYSLEASCIRKRTPVAKRPA